MRQSDAHTWALLRQHSTGHIRYPDWLGGGRCMIDAEVRGRVQLPDVPESAVLLSRTLSSPDSPAR